MLNANGASYPCRHRGRHSPLGQAAHACLSAWATRPAFDRPAEITRYAVGDRGVLCCRSMFSPLRIFNRDAKEVTT